MSNHQLTARFSMPAERLEYFAEQAGKGAMFPYEFVITPISKEVSRVTGRPQEIMFLIGEVANNGEDNLISVRKA